jgi:heptosyltransferase-1
MDYSSMKKVLIIRLGKIGDIVTTSFVFEIFKFNFPQIDIYLLTLNLNRDVLEFNPTLKKIYYSKNNLILLWNLLKLKFLKFDLILDFNDNESVTSSLIFRFLKARFKAGYNFKRYENIINIKVNPLKKEESHIIERMRDFLIQIGIPVEESKVKPFFYISPSIRSEIEENIDHKGKLIAVNLSAGAKIRYWSKDKWVDLLNSILKEYPSFKLLLLSTPADKVLRQAIYSELSRVQCPGADQLSIQYFAAYIQISNILITPDTSAVHIASAFGVPLIALYPNYTDNFISWQPYKTPHRSIKSSGESINQISVAEVLMNFKSLVKELNL